MCLFIYFLSLSMCVCFLCVRAALDREPSPCTEVAARRNVHCCDHHHRRRRHLRHEEQIRHPRPDGSYDGIAAGGAVFSVHARGTTGRAWRRQHCRRGRRGLAAASSLQGGGPPGAGSAHAAVSTVRSSPSCPSCVGYYSKECYFCRWFCLLPSYLLVS